MNALQRNWWLPDNPYVFNENYFANVTNVRYEDTRLALLIRVNFIVATTLGFLSVGLVFYLILFRAPAYIKPYSRMLLICAFADLYFMIGDFWCQPRMRINKGTMLFAMTGPVARFFGYYGQCYSMALQTTGPYISFGSLPVQYFIRYHTVKYDRPLSGARILLYFLAPITMTLIASALSVKGFCTYDNREGVDFAQFWHPEVPIPPHLIISTYTDPSIIILLAYFFLSVIGSYSMSMWLARRTVAELERHAESMTPKTRSIQRQFARTLLAYSLTPLFTSMAPTLMAIAGTLSGIDTRNLGDAIIVMVNWFPSANSACTIIFISPFRRIVLKFLHCEKLFDRFKHFSSSVESRE